MSMLQCDVILKRGATSRKIVVANESIRTLTHANFNGRNNVY